MQSNKHDDPFGRLVSEKFFPGNTGIDGYKLIHLLLKLDSEGKLTKKQREFWIPPEYRFRNQN
jgi:hypothetical protein